MDSYQSLIVLVEGIYKQERVGSGRNKNATPVLYTAPHIGGCALLFLLLPHGWDRWKGHQFINFGGTRTENVDFWWSADTKILTLYIPENKNIDSF